MDGVDVYSTAKSEYTEQFCLFLVPALQSYFLGLIDEAREKEKDTRRVLWMFQNLLKDIPEWNQDKVIRVTESIVQTTRCDYLEELLTAVFIAHTKVLSAIRLTNRDKKKIQISVPKLEHFLHRTLSESARILWSNAYLFSEQGTSIERQKNLRQVEQLLHQAVLQSIRGMLPVKSILREYLNNDGDGDGEATEEGSNAEKKEEKDEEEEEEEEEKEKEEKPVSEEDSGISIDLSGSQVDVSGAEVPSTPPNTPSQVVVEPSPEVPVEMAPPAPETAPAPVPEPVPAPPPTAPAVQQVLVFETEPSVKFAEHDTVFDTENQLAHRIRSKSADFDMDEEDGIKILDEEPEAMDGFEDIDGPKDEGVDDFETLE
jgi:hypothetical protein